MKKWWLLFWAFQALSLVLTVMGWILLIAPSLTHLWVNQVGKIHWKLKILWLWDNDLDGICQPLTAPTAWGCYRWSALRNPSSNLRLVPGMAGAGLPSERPYYRLEYRGYYFHMGWHNGTYPVLSAGSL